MKALLAGLISLVIAAPSFAHQGHVNGQRHFHGHRHLHHMHRHHVPIIIHRHHDNWVAPLVGGVILGAVIADAKAKEEQVKVEKVLVCTEWKEVMTDDGKIYKERTCKDL